MKRFFLFGAILCGSLVVGGGVFFWWDKGEPMQYENPEKVSVPQSIPKESDENPPEIQGDRGEPSIQVDRETVNREIGMPTPPVNEVSKVESVPKKEPIVSADLEITERLIDFGFRETSGRTIDTVVLHSSYNASGGAVYDIDDIIEQYKDYQVGAHYLIARSGEVVLLVPERQVAYHAGVSKMPDGRKNVNEFSIGIEMVGTLESGYTEAQYRALKALLALIKSRHNIRHIVGHSDIAPERKTDPWKFDWNKLATP